MAPPVAVIVVASIATSAAVAYAVKEAWEPYIKPELTKASNTARAWLRRRQRRSVPVPTTPQEHNNDSDRRSRSPDVPDQANVPGPSRLETLVHSAFQMPTEADPSTFMRHRSTANRNGAATPNPEAVEMTELDKANPWIYHPPMSPAISSLPGTARNSMVSNASSNATETDPFHDIHRYNPQVSYPSTTLRHDQGLQLSFAGPSPFGTTELPPPFHQQQSQTTLTPTSYRSSNTASDRSPTTALEPNSRTMTSSPASAFSWMDPTSPRRSVGTSYGAGAHPDDFVHLHDDDIRSENAFSIGSYDDLSNMGSGSSNHGRTPLDRSDAGSDDDEPMSPPHNSEQGSARSRSRSPSDWESVGSPSSSASHHRLV